MGTVTLNDEAVANGYSAELIDTLKSKQYEYDSLVVKIVNFYYPDTTWMPEQNVCTEYEFQGVTYFTDSTFFVQAGPNKNGCDSVVAYRFKVIGSRLHDFNIVTNEPYKWYNDDVDTTYKQSTQKYVDWTMGGCDQVLHLNLTIVDNPITYCADDNNVAVIEFTNDSLVPSELYELFKDQSDPVRLVNTSHHSGDLSNAPYTYNDTLMFFYIRPVYNQTIDTVSCGVFTWNGIDYADTGIYTQNFVSQYGCDSTVTMNLWINNHAASDSNWVVERCDEFNFHYEITYDVAGNDTMPAASWNFLYDSTFKASTETTVVLKNAYGCDSIVNLSLTINKNTPVVVRDTACDLYTWTVSNNAASETAGTYSYASDESGDFEYAIEATDANGCVATDSLYLFVKHSVHAAWDTLVNGASYTYKNRFFQAPADVEFFDTLATAQNGCDSILDVHIIVNAGDAMAVTKNSCGLYTWTAADHGNGHTYKWISAAESAANGNALYKDITNSDSVVYIHTGSEPMEQLYTVNANGDSVLMMTYVLHLNLLEAGFGDTTIARYPISMGNTIALSYGDSLQTVSYTIPENKRPTWNNTSVQIDTTLYFEYADGGYYCGNYVDLHLTAVHNYDTAAAIVNCYEVDSMKWNGVRYDIPVGDSNEYTIATGTGYDVQYTTYYVTRKSFVGSTIADSVVCSLFQWNKGDNDSIYTESTTNVVTRIAKNGCDSVVTILNLTVNTVNNQSLAATGCDSIFWADKGANGKWYYATTTDTIQYKDANNCLVVDTMKLTVVPTVHHMVLDTTVCDSYTWHEASYTATGKYAYDYTTDSNGVTCHHADTLKLTVNNSIETYPDSLVFGENFRMDGQLYTAPFSGIVVRNLQTVAGCDSTANVNLTVSFYTDENVVREACGVYEWIAADNGNGHYYRSITDEESAANGNALYYDETDGAYVTANPVYTPVRGQANYGYRYHLQLSLYGAVFSEKDTTFLLSNNNGIMTYNGEDFDYSALLTAKTGKDTIHAVRFGAVAGACDSIQTLTVHVVYNYTHSKETVCAENGNTLSWRNKTWNIGAPNSTVTLVDTANKNTQQMWIYTHDVTRRAAIATTATPVDVCDQFVWGGETFTKDTNNVSKTFTSVLTGCDSVVTIANIVIRHSSQYDSTKVICDQFQWTERSDSLYKASTVDTVTIVNAAGCDSLQILHLTINKNLGSNITVNACDEYTWKVGNNTIGTYINNGNDVNQSGSYYNPSTDANGCQAFDTLILVVNASSHVADTEYVGEGSVRYNGRLYVAPAEYFRYDTTWADDTHTEFVPNAVGCYNITDVLVKVGNFYHRDEMYVKCNSFTWPVNGHTYNWISADERAANGNALYYDATAEEYVTVNPTYTIANEGDYDSIIMLMLTLTQNTTSTDEVTFPVSLAYLHYGDSTFNYTAQRDLALNGGNFAGYEDVRDVHFASVEYCDSVVTVSVHVVNNYTQVATDDICATQTSYTWRGHEISTVTTDYDNLHYYYVYDTVGTEEEPVVEYIKVAQHPVVYAVERRYACDSYEWNGETFTESVTNYTKFFENGSSYGCDSTVVLHLTVYNTTSALTEETVCDTYTWTAANGDFTRTYTQSIDTIVRYDNVYQYKTCHSADTLRLTVNHKQTHTETVSACDSYDMYTYDVATETYVVDTTFNTDTTGYVRVLTNMNGCDSTVTLNLTIRHSSPVVDSVAVACGSFTANSGAVYYTSGIYFDTIMNVAQCDSVTKFTVTINNGAKNDYAFVCDSISWHDSTYAIAGTYTFSVNDQCADTLVIGEVRLATHDVYTDTACNNYTWTFTNNMYDYVGDSVLYDYEDSRYYTTGGVKTNNYVNTVGCPSVDTLNLTINRRSFAEDVVTACGSYDWYVNDSLIGTFTQSIETQTSFFNNTTKCDSVTFLKLTILEAPVVDTAAAICQSALPYTWRGTEMTEAGVESVVFPMENGCDSTVRFTLTVNPVYETNLTAQVCLGQGYNENNFDIAASELPEAGEYTFTDNLQTVNGCDSVVTLTVTVGNILTNVIEVASCDSYVWNGTVYTQSGDYTHSYNNDMGCASVDTLRLTINVNHGVTENQTVCTSYSWNGTEYTEAGTYRVHFADENGCFGDSVLNLSIAPTEQLSYERSACESYTWSDGDGETYTESGTYTYEYTNAEGCNGIATLYLTVNNAEPTNTAIVACNSYSWNGTVYTESGVYTSETTDENGCTAVDTLTLTLNSSLAESIDATVCGIYVWNGMAYNESGSYQQTFTSVNGCDSVVTLNLTINEAITSAISEETCGSYTWNGISYSASGVYTQTFSTESGCDSVVTLTLTIGNVATSDTAATACGSFEWHGTTYSQSGVYTYTYNEEGGCDSIVTLTLTINTPANTTESAVACDSYTWNGQTYTTSGVYTHSFTDANGCEATATLNLTINEGGNTVVNETVCDSYTLNGMTYTTSGVYTQPTVSENGCVGTITLNLTVNESVNVTETVEACGSYTWNGTTYTTSQTFSSTTTGSNGCDSTTTVVLTINNAQTVAAAPVSACGSYAWNGQIITTSGNYSYTTTGSNGCDSTTTINVTIHNTTYGDTTAVACGSFVWNGVAYTQSGSYQNVEAYTSVNGCDSIVTLNLTINNPVDVVVDETACDSYTWTVDGQTYTTSGTYVSPVMQTVNGCDSTVTLNLTVNHSSSYAVTTSAVGSYEWNGETYTESGVYTWTGTNAEGCDSTVTLNLTVTPATYTVIIGVNDPMMGNVTNGGMREVAAGETITVTASPNVGYHFVDWSNGSTDATITVVVTSDTTLTANFAVNTYVIEAVASDATMGTVTGSGEYTYGATVVLEATANAGYRFVRWSTGETDAHIEFVATEDLSVIAYFESVGIDDVDDNTVEIYSTDSRIIVKGAENKDVYVYDVNGRCVRRQAKATETIEFTMSVSGVYLVKVGDMPAKRVVVVR